jgi:hypothetical protein
MQPFELWASIRFVAGWFWRWDVISIGSVFMYGLGVSAMYGGDYVLAAAFYVFSILWVTIKTIAWESVERHENRAAVSILMVLVALVVLFGSLGWDEYRFAEVELILSASPAINVPNIMQKFLPLPPLEPTPKPRVKGTHPEQPIASPSPTQVAPSYGNLKARTITLAQNIKAFVQNRNDEMRKYADYPNLSTDEAKSWSNLANFLFRSEYLPKVISIHDELAGRDFRDSELEETLNRVNHQIELQSDPRWSQNASIYFTDIQKVGERLFLLGNQLPE